MDSEDEKVEDEIENILDTVDGECHFFRSLMRARPVGVNRFFHVITMQAAIENGVQQEVSIEDIWHKLESCYNLEQLEHLEAEYEMNANSSNSSTPQPTPSPKPDQNLAAHPWFRTEFMLPQDQYIDDLIATRRLRATPSPPGTPEPIVQPRRRGRKRKVTEPEPEQEREREQEQEQEEQRTSPKSGDSDISELTQQSGDDDEAAPTPSDRPAPSIATATEAGTEEQEEDEEDEAKDAPKERKKPGRKPGRGRGGRRGRRKK